MDSQIVNISLPAKLLRLADQVAEKEARTRSDLFREAIRSYVMRKTQWQNIFAYGQQKAKNLKMKEKDVEKIINEYRSGK